MLALVSACGVSTRHKLKPFASYPTADVAAAYRLADANACGSFLDWFQGHVGKWTLNRSDAANLNFRAADCLQRLGRTAEARRICASVRRQEPETGWADHADACLAGDSWTIGRVVSMDPPWYAGTERILEREGFVQLVLVVDEHGSLEGFRTLESTSDAFLDAVLERLDSARISPPLRNGHPVRGHVDFRVQYVLGKNDQARRAATKGAASAREARARHSSGLEGTP